MTSDEYAQVLVTLNVPPTLEDVVTDWLLARDEAAGFTSLPVSGHSTGHAHLSAAEQVTGKQRRLQYQVQIRSRDAADFVAAARRSFGSAGVHYSVMPLLSGGHLDADADITADSERH